MTDLERILLQEVAYRAIREHEDAIARNVLPESNERNGALSDHGQVAYDRMVKQIHDAASPRTKTLSRESGTKAHDSPTPNHES